VGVASFPFLSQLYSEGKLDELNRLLNATFKGIIALLVPISALTIAQSAPIVYLVFAGPRMHGADLDATAATLVFFSLGMFAWGAQNILARGFYATRSTLTPAIVGTVLTFASLPLYWLAVVRWQHVGLALASSTAMMLYAVFLFFLLNRRTQNRQAGAMMLFFTKVCAASVVTGWLCHRLQTELQPFIAWHRRSGDLLLLVIVTSVGLLLLLVLGKLLGIRELDTQFARLWSLARRNPHDPASGASPKTATQ
jgi:putative peptidoglycan lipid II flippase